MKALRLLAMPFLALVGGVGWVLRFYGQKQMAKAERVYCGRMAVLLYEQYGL